MVMLLTIKLSLRNRISNKMLTSTKHFVMSSPGEGTGDEARCTCSSMTTKRTDLIGHGNILLWQQLDSLQYDLTVSISVKGVACKTM